MAEKAMNSWQLASTQHGFASTQYGWIKLAVLALLIAVPVIGYGGLSYVCPCDRSPGGYLFGREVSEPMTDWSIANQVPLCQLQVGGALPHSINLNCMSSGGKLYVSCSSCEGKRWSAIALSNPRGRIRMNGLVYPVTMTRVEDAAALDEVWRARAQKLGGGDGSPRPEAWWSFQMVSR
jgi:hypothetical protein